MTRLGFLLVSVIVVTTQPQPTTQSKTPRKVEVVRGTPIAEKLLPDDEFVEVERGDVISRYVDDRVLSLPQDLDERVEFSDAIAVVEPRGTSSYLIENGEWVQSTLDLHSLEGLKDHKPPLFDRNGNTTIVHDGGELQIKGVRVRAGQYYLFKPGERYLVFLKARSTASNTRVFFIGMQFRITSEGLIAPMYLSDGTASTAPSAFHGVSLKQIKEEFRSRLKR